MHIHYTQGPAVLSDISVDVFNQIECLLQDNCTPELICSSLGVSAGVVATIDNIVNSHMRRCVFCGAIFDPKGRTRANSCGSVHFLPCIDCGTPVQVKESFTEYIKAGGRRCPQCRSIQIGRTRKNKSEEEKQAIVAKQEATMLQRYGARNALQVPEIKSKVDATVRQRYGVESNLSQSKEIQERIKKNSQKRFGLDHYTNAPEIRQRMIDGMIVKYGVANAQQCASIQEKTRQTNLLRYGVENVFQNADIRAKFVENHLAKYGVEWPHQRPDLIEQVKQSNLTKYGAVMRPLSDEYLMKFISDPSKFSQYKQFMNNPEKYIAEHYTSKPSVRQLSEDLGITDSPIYDKLISIGKRDLATEFCYSMEGQLIEVLLSLNPYLEIQLHDRKILRGKEIDIFLPELHLGFECNPTYTHNSSFQDPWGNPPKDYKYHATKSKCAAEQGVFLYHIFGYEWATRRTTIISQIQNLIGANTSTIYARKTQLVDVSYSDAVQFLESNHRQGSAQSKVRLGLRDTVTGELVSLMTFGKTRPGIGRRVENEDNDWELIRFCNKLGTTVVGGASKLFKYFVGNWAPAKVISFSDIAHTRGNLYSLLGFDEISQSDPGYVWVNLITDTYYNRVSCQKANLLHLFDDVDESDISAKTESEIMMEHGYARVFDSGVIRWEYSNKS